MGKPKSIWLKRASVAAVLLLVSLAVLRETYGDPPQGAQPRGAEELNARRLIPATATMVTAWDVPRNPLADSTLGTSARADRIRRGFRLFMQTPREAPRYTANKLACANCHLNGGQRDKALPLVGVAAVFPEFNKREGRLFSLEDRIVGCFMRSENATGSRSKAAHSTTHLPQAYPDTGSEEVTAIAAYITWLSEGIQRGEKLPWRGHNVISPDSCLPVNRLDPARGKTLYMKNCQTCHGTDGQGVQIGDKRAGPLWGRSSWNDGAGTARIYTLAGFIRYAMPYLNPGALTDEEAQQIAAFITSLPRPEYPLKDLDYRTSGVPPDAVYYRDRHQAK